MSDENTMGDGLEAIGDTKVAPSHGIAAIALHMAMKYHDITMIKDGTLYQQYKLEGKNFTAIHLDMVFETAKQIEAHLLASSERIATIVVEAITAGVKKSENELDAVPVAEAGNE